MDKSRAATVFLGILALVALGAVFKAAKGVILPLVVAWLLSYLFSPLVRFLERKHIPPALSIAAIIVTFLGVCFQSVAFMYDKIMLFANAFPRYYSRLMGLVNAAGENFGIPPGFWQNFDLGPKIASYLLGLPASAATLLMNLFLVMIFLVFILLGAPYLEYKLRYALSPDTAEKVQKAIDSVSHQIGRYLSTLFFISLSTGICVWLALAFLRVDFAVTWGVLAFVLNFIPTLGSIAASIPPVLVALVKSYPFLGHPLIVAAALLVIQVTIGNIITPKLMGDRLNLSPVGVLVFLLFWGWLWGIPGALLAVPIAATTRIICENVDSLAFIGVMMGSGKNFKKNLAGPT